MHQHPLPPSSPPTHAHTRPRTRTHTIHSLIKAHGTHSRCRTRLCKCTDSHVQCSQYLSDCFLSFFKNIFSDMRHNSLSFAVCLSGSLPLSLSLTPSLPPRLQSFEVGCATARCFDLVSLQPCSPNAFRHPFLAHKEISVPASCLLREVIQRAVKSIEMGSRMMFSASAGSLRSSSSPLVSTIPSSHLCLLTLLNSDSLADTLPPWSASLCSLYSHTLISSLHLPLFLRLHLSTWHRQVQHAS